MRILVATDGSPHSQAAVDAVCKRSWPAGTIFKVLHVIHVPIPEWANDPLIMFPAMRADLLEEARRVAPEVVEKAAEKIREQVKGVQVETQILEGSPKKDIVEEAERWKADSILIGSHGRGPAKRFLLGSVSHAVALHAPCSVEIVRVSEPSAAAS